MRRSLLIATAAAAMMAGVLIASEHGLVAAAPGDISINALSCDSSPEYVRIHNYGVGAQSLTGFHIQSDPSQDYLLTDHVAAIGAGQTLEFQSGTGAADNPGAGIYKLTGSFIYRNSPDTTDYAQLLRSDATTNHVNCGTNPTPPPTATHTPTATPAHTPTPTPTATFTHSPTPTPSPTTTATGGTTCGVERWSVKTLSDPDVGLVNFTPQDTTVDTLRALPKPGSLPPDNRIPPTEETTFRVTAQAEQMKLEDDHDIHLVIADLSNATDTMIVEFPDPACDGAAQSTHEAEMAAARQQFVNLFGQPSASHFTSISGTVVITGVGFFDFLHGQTGVAPNGIELHPALSIALGTPTPTAVSSLTATPTPTLTPTPTPAPTHTPCPTVSPTNCDIASPPPGPEALGNVDCVNGIDFNDALAVLAAIGGVGSVPCANNADVNCSGVTDVSDVLGIFRFLAGLPRLPAASDCPAIGT